MSELEMQCKEAVRHGAQHDTPAQIIYTSTISLQQKGDLRLEVPDYVVSTIPGTSQLLTSTEEANTTGE